MGLVVPAVLPSSRKDLEEKLSLFSKIPSVSRIQIDVVDGRLAEPASWPYSDSTPSTSSGQAGSPQAALTELEAMVQKSEMLPYLESIAYEIDLMCFDALHAAEEWLALGASRLTFHAESDTNITRLFESVRNRYGHFISLGVALNIESDLALIEPCLGEIEYVQFMGIAHIGMQGQPFDERVLNKIRVFHGTHPEIAVQVDGGVSPANAKKLVALGVTNLVIGSGILRSKDPTAEVAKFEALQTLYGV